MHFFVSPFSLLQNEKHLYYDIYGEKNMPRKTLALISGLVIITLILFVFALRSSNQTKAPVQPPPPPVVANPTAATPAHSVLSISPNTITVQPGGLGSADVVIDTSDNPVTAVQLEISYDPSLLSNVKVVTGPLFQNPVVLINKNDPATGQLTYAFGITPNHPTVSGIGTVATISFTAKNVPGKQTSLTLLPKSLVTARGVRDSVLKNATGATVIIGGAGAGTGVGTGTTNQSAPAQSQTTPR